MAGMQALIATQPGVSVRALEIRAGRGRVLVSEFSWQHDAGAIAWLTGENGTGKSSLLRVLAGCRRPTSGAVSWRDNNNRIGYYTPAMQVATDLRVRDWVDLVESCSTVMKPNDTVAQLRPRVSDDRRFRELSTGEAKRFLIWALLLPMRGPLILDEPYEHLSREAKGALTEVLRLVAVTDVVVVATNQDVPLAPGEQLLSLDGSEIRIGS